MTIPKTLLQLAGADHTIPSIENTLLLLVDYQNEYCEGPIALQGARHAIKAAGQLLARAREVSCPIIHVAHKGRAGGMFDREGFRGEFIAALTPENDEAIIEKALPNAFSSTSLGALVGASGCKNIVIAGFMTHMCVSSTARAAMENGLSVYVDADCCATRDLPDGQGGLISADMVHATALAALSDRFAIIVRNHRW